MTEIYRFEDISRLEDSKIEKTRKINRTEESSSGKFEGKLF